MLSCLFRFHKYSPFEKAYATLLYVTGLSLRDVSERYRFTHASRESVRKWVHRLKALFKSMRKARRLIAIDETIVKRFGVNNYLWAAIDIDSGEIIALYASRERSLARSLTFLRRVLKACNGKPIILVDRPMVSMGPKEAWNKVFP